MSDIGDLCDPAMHKFDKSRDCEHGNLARSCRVCELEAEVERLNRRLEAIVAYAELDPSDIDRVVRVYEENRPELPVAKYFRVRISEIDEYLGNGWTIVGSNTFGSCAEFVWMRLVLSGPGLQEPARKGRMIREG